MELKTRSDPEGKQFAEITIDGEKLTRSEIIQKWKSSESFRLIIRELVQRPKAIPEMPVNEPNYQKLGQNPPKKYEKNKLLKSARNATGARSGLYSIFCKTHPFSNIDSLPYKHTVNTEKFKQIFFNEKHQPQYERLDTLPKLLVCQYVLHKQPDNTLKGYPFTFRLPNHLHRTNTQKLNKKIQQKLTAALNRGVLFWMTRETDGKSFDKTLTHYHGEILINPNEYKQVKKAFLQLFNAKNKPVQAHHNTIIKNPMPDKAIIDLHVSARNSNTANHGKFYSIFNWVAYSTKQELGRKKENFVCQIQKKQLPSKQKFHYVSANLNKAASNFYKANIGQR